MTDGKLRVYGVAWLMVACGLPSLAAAAEADDRQRPDRLQMHSARNESGVAVTLSSRGFIDRRNPFFQELGVIGRSCVSCHQPAEGWSVTPQGLRERFDRSQGLDPVFRLNDGANSPLVDVSTQPAREQAYAMLLRQGAVPGRPAGSGRRRVRAGESRRSLPLRQHQRAVAVPPPPRDDQPALPQHGDVGRPRDLSRGRHHDGSHRPRGVGEEAAPVRKGERVAPGHVEIGFVQQRGRATRSASSLQAGIPWSSRTGLAQLALGNALGQAGRTQEARAALGPDRPPGGK